MKRRPHADVQAQLLVAACTAAFLLSPVCLCEPDFLIASLYLSV